MAKITHILPNRKTSLEFNFIKPQNYKEDGCYSSQNYL